MNSVVGRWILGLSLKYLSSWKLPLNFNYHFFWGRPTTCIPEVLPQSASRPYEVGGNFAT